MAFSSRHTISVLGCAPTRRSISCPAFNTNSAGMLRMRKRSAVTGFSSTFSFATRTRPDISLASCSTTGEIIWQGPHQAAYRSSSTGRGERSISAENVASVTVMGWMETGSGFLHRPQTGASPCSIFSSGTRLVAPQTGQRMSCASGIPVCSQQFARIEVRFSPELLKQILLLGGQLRRNHYLDFHVLIAPAATALVVPRGEPLTAQPEPLSALCPRRNLHLHGSIESRHRNFSSQGRFPRRYRELDLDIRVANDLKQRMWFDSYMQVEIARRPYVVTWFALPSQADYRALPHARRDVYFQRLHAIGPRGLQRDVSLDAAMRLFERERNLGFDVLRGHPEIGAAPCAAAAAEQAFEKVVGVSCAAKAVRKVREVRAVVSGAGWTSDIS